MLKNITLSADEYLIAQARKRAQAENRTVNELFREWLTRYVERPSSGEEYDRLMEELSHVELVGPFSREEMNER